MSADKPQNNSTPFTLEDRRTIQKTSEMTKQIYDCLFGDPDNPTGGLFLMCNLNTRFRQNMTTLLWILLPVLATTILTVIGMLFKFNVK